MASGRNDPFERGSVQMLRQAKIKFQELMSARMKKRWPQGNLEGIEWGIFEQECGHLDARRKLPGGGGGIRSSMRSNRTKTGEK